MKRLVFGGFAVILVVLATAMMAGAQSDSPSLGDYARSMRKNKAQDTTATQKIYDNDNLPAEPSISVVGGSTASNENGNTNSAAQAPQGPSDPSQIKPGQSEEARQKAYAAWKQRIDQQRQKIDQLASDVQSYTHGATMPIAQTWPYNQQYQQGLADKQKALDQAKAELGEMQEQARRAGVPSAVIE
jgi:hypothetical protein